MIITRRILTASALVAAATLSLGACGSSKQQTPAAAPTAEATTQSATTAPARSPDPALLGARNRRVRLERG